MIKYKTAKINGLDIFYREAGNPENPAILLLHGFPTSSHMFRNLILRLSERYFLVAPDYPGFGQSSAPPVHDFDYSFDNLALIMQSFIDYMGLEKFGLYLMDYGAPVGFRIASEQPERISSLIIQNGNAYDEGLQNFWEPIKAYWREPDNEERIARVRELLTPESTKWQYTHGVRDAELISPDNWLHDQALLDRPGNNEIQLKLFLSYGSNPPLYPKWQQYFRQYQPPTLITWGEYDFIFPAAGAHPYRRDLPDAEIHLLNAGHFALEDQGHHIAELIDDFMKRNVTNKQVPVARAL